MAEEQELTALQRYGRGQSSPLVRFVVRVAIAAGAIAFVAVGIYFGTRATDQREAREEILDSRYVEKIELFESNSGGHPERVKIDGTVREDCEATEDDYLTCEDAPQPTREPSAE